MFFLSKCLKFKLVKVWVDISEITALLNFELKICPKNSVLLRFLIKRIRPSNTVSIILNLPFEVGKLI